MKTNLTNPLRVVAGGLLAAGKPLPGEALIAWQKAFGWSPIDLAYLCLGWTPSK